LVQILFMEMIRSHANVTQLEPPRTFYVHLGKNKEGKKKENKYKETNRRAATTSHKWRAAATKDEGNKII